MFKIKNSLFIAISCLLALTACKKGDSPTGGTSTEGAAKLSFTINGIDNTEAIVNADVAGTEQMAAARNTPIRSTQLISEKEIHGTDNDMLVNVTGIGLQQDAVDGSTAAGSGAAGRQMVNVGGKQMAVTTPMLSGGKYRVFIYDDAGATVSVIDGQAGTAITPIPVSAGKKYTWVAYTYNTTADIPAPADNNNPGFNIDINSAVYVARGSISSTAPGDNKAPLTFKNVLAKVKIIVDARGVFAPIALTFGTSPTTNPPSMGVRRNSTGGLYNLKTGTMSNLNTAIDRGINYPVTQVSDATKDSVIAMTYTVLPGTVRLPDTVSAYLKNDYGNEYYYLNKRFNGQTITAASGNIYNVNMQLIASYNTIADVRWAKTNLYMTSANPGYRFRTSTYMDHKYPETGQITGGEYWQFMQLTPLQNTASVTTAALPTQGDPCRQVKPLDRWRLPYQYELQQLSDYINNNKSNGNSSFYVNTSDAALWLIGTYFPASGYVYLNGTNVVKSPVGTGRYWSQDGAGNGQGWALQLNAPGATSETRRAFLIPDSQASIDSYAGNGNYIRCVRMY